MDKLALQFFPYPHVLEGARRAGMFVRWPTKCERCPTRECEKTQPGELSQCRFGLNFRRVSEDLLVAGVVVRNYRPETVAGGKMRRMVGKESVTRDEFERVIERCTEDTTALAAEMRERKARVIDEYRESGSYQQEVLERLRPEMRRAFASVHDYKQFVQQIRQNLEVHLQNRFGGARIGDIAQLVEKASHEERAIYWTAVMMDERLDATLLVLEPQRISTRMRRTRIRLHGLVSKYGKIYRARIDSKRLHLREIGESYAEVETDPVVISVIPHALIDNAIKYAPDGGDITLTFRETDDTVSLSVMSDGPRIAPNESEKIFELFVQGEAAKAVAPEGTGFGLGAAQLVATELGTKIQVAQEATPSETGFFRTEFSVTFGRAHDGGGRPAHPAGRARRRR